MTRGRRTTTNSLASIGRRLITLAVLFAFVTGSVIHLSHADAGAMPTVVAVDVSTDGSDDAEPKALAMDHCHCVVAAPWLDQSVSLRPLVLRHVPLSVVLGLATRHPENDARPPKA